MLGFSFPFDLTFSLVQAEVEVERYNPLFMDSSINLCSLHYSKHVNTDCIWHKFRKTTYEKHQDSYILSKF